MSIQARYPLKSLHLRVHPHLQQIQRSSRSLRRPRHDRRTYGPPAHQTNVDVNSAPSDPNRTQAQHRRRPQSLPPRAFPPAVCDPPKHCIKCRHPARSSPSSTQTHQRPPAWSAGRPTGPGAALGARRGAAPKSKADSAPAVVVALMVMGATSGAVSRACVCML